VVSEADVELVRRAQERWIRNERDATMEFWARDATMNAPKEWPEVARSEGIERIRAVFDGFDDALSPEWPTQMEIQRLEDLCDGRVLMELGWNASGVSSGISVFQEIAGIYTVTDGKIYHADFFTSHKEARKGAGLEP
jgi:ketosteroid isomerase-like protein